MIRWPESLCLCQRRRIPMRTSRRICNRYMPNSLPSCLFPMPREVFTTPCRRSRPMPSIPNTFGLERLPGRRRRMRLPCLYIADDAASELDSYYFVIEDRRYSQFDRRASALEGNACTGDQQVCLLCVNIRG